MAFSFPDNMQAEWIEPSDMPAAPKPLAAVAGALAAPAGGIHWEQYQGARTAAIAVNDKTRPVPHDHLLPPLLRRLEALGLEPAAIHLIIATGTHAPMPPDEYRTILPAEILARYPVLCHDTDNTAELVHLGTTARGTPIWINRHYWEADLRIVVGNIEPHYFQGFSGGVKSAAIGLAGQETINHNHALMTNPRSRLGNYHDNPARQDVEEIGQRIGVHIALNAVLNGHKQIVRAIAGEPQAVMELGIPISRQICQVAVRAPFDLVIASPGGHPKDLNLYQSQKALAHAAQVARDGGTVIVAAACPEGSGSLDLEAWMEGTRSYDEVFARFKREGFRIGPHKAYQIARDAARVRTILVSTMPCDRVQRLLLHPAATIDEALAMALPCLAPGTRVGIMPRASSTIPYIV